MVSSTSLLAGAVTLSNLIIGSLSGGCRFVNFETSGVKSYGPILIDPSICPTFDLAVADSFFNFACSEVAPNIIVPSLTEYTGSNCAVTRSNIDGLPGDCTLPTTGCNIYEVELEIISGAPNCGIIDPDDCDPTCGGFAETVGTITILATDGGSNECLIINSGESVLYSDISVDNGFNVQVFNNEDCSGTPINIIDYSPGCRSDNIFITVELIDGAETTPAPSEED